LLSYLLQVLYVPPYWFCRHESGHLEDINNSSSSSSNNNHENEDINNSDPTTNINDNKSGSSNNSTTNYHRKPVPSVSIGLHVQSPSLEMLILLEGSLTPIFNNKGNINDADTRIIFAQVSYWSIISVYLLLCYCPFT